MIDLARQTPPSLLTGISGHLKLKKLMSYHVTRVDKALLNKKTIKHEKALQDGPVHWSYYAMSEEVIGYPDLH